MSNSSSDNRTVEIVSKERAYDGFFAIDRYRVRHRTPNGETVEVTREVFERGDSAVLLAYDPQADTVLLVDEFRIGRFAAGHKGADCWSTGIVAGSIDPGDDARTTVLREAVEEAGLAVTSEQLIGPLTIFPSPGGTSEMISIFIACTSLDPDALSGDNNVGAGEFTEPRVVDRKIALDGLFNSPCNGPAATALLWLERLIAAGDISRPNTPKED